MYTKEEKKRAIEYCHAHGMDVDETIARLGYPSRSSLFYWLSDAGLSKRRHVLKYPFDVRMKALRMAYGQNLTLAEVARQLGIKNPVSISICKRRYSNGEVDTLVEKGAFPWVPAGGDRCCRMRLTRPRRGSGSSNSRTIVLWPP